MRIEDIVAKQPSPARPRAVRHVVKEVFRFHEGARGETEGPDHFWEVWRLEVTPEGKREARAGVRFHTAREADAWVAKRDGPGSSDEGCEP